MIQIQKEFESFPPPSLRQKSPRNSAILAAGGILFPAALRRVSEIGLCPKKQENAFCGKIEGC